MAVCWTAKYTLLVSYSYSFSILYEELVGMSE